MHNHLICLQNYYTYILTLSVYYTMCHVYSHKLSGISPVLSDLDLLLVGTLYRYPPQLYYYSLDLIILNIAPHLDKYTTYVEANK